MNKEFIKTCIQCDYDWLTWLGYPMLYDGDLCVCRSAEDRINRNFYYNIELVI